MLFQLARFSACLHQDLLCLPLIKWVHSNAQNNHLIPGLVWVWVCHLEKFSYLLFCPGNPKSRIQEIRYQLYLSNTHGSYVWAKGNPACYMLAEYSTASLSSQYRMYGQRSWKHCITQYIYTECYWLLPRCYGVSDSEVEGMLIWWIGVSSCLSISYISPPSHSIWISYCTSVTFLGWIKKVIFFWHWFINFVM